MIGKAVSLKVFRIAILKKERLGYVGQSGSNQKSRMFKVHYLNYINVNLIAKYLCLKHPILRDYYCVSENEY